MYFLCDRQRDRDGGRWQVITLEVLVVDSGTVLEQKWVEIFDFSGDSELASCVAE